MAIPTINNLVLPQGGILVLPDEGDQPTTGTIFRRSTMGGGYYRIVSEGSTEVEYDHVLFVREMTTPVTIDEVVYAAMHINAVVGLIPD